MKNDEPINLITDYSGIEVILIDKFAVVKETLERMGIKNERTKKFYPSCYLLKDKDDKYRIYHFKQLFARDGQETTYNLIDHVRLKTIVHLLDKWGLVSAVDEIDKIMGKKIDILAHREKKIYEVSHKYMFMRDLENSEE
jgi:hypothetical protein